MTWDIRNKRGEMGTLHWKWSNQIFSYLFLQLLCLAGTKGVSLRWYGLDYSTNLNPASRLEK